MSNNMLPESFFTTCGLESVIANGRECKKAGGVEDTFPHNANDTTFAVLEETKSNMRKLLRAGYDGKHFHFDCT